MMKNQVFFIQQVIPNVPNEMYRMVNQKKNLLNLFQ